LDTLLRPVDFHFPNDFYIILVSNLLIMSVPEEGYSKNAAWSLSSISSFVFLYYFALHFIKAVAFCSTLNSINCVLLITDIVDIMKRKCKQWWSSVPLISIKINFYPSHASKYLVFQRYMSWSLLYLVILRWEVVVCFVGI